MGAIIFPKISPSLIQLFFIGERIFEFVMPKTKNINATPSAHNLLDSELINGQRAINKNTTKNTRPKLLLELIFISSIIKITTLIEDLKDLKNNQFEARLDLMSVLN